MICLPIEKHRGFSGNSRYPRKTFAFFRPNITQPIPATFNEVLRAIANEQKPAAIVAPAKPFLKWVGGKRSVLPELLARMPSEYSEYIEPFMGGGALFFAVQPHTAYLSDINLHLVLAYRAIRDNVEDLIVKLKAHSKKHSKTYFLEARKRLSTESGPVAIAALLIYLNKTCFNGLYRVNIAGDYNVPMGDYKRGFRSPPGREGRVDGVEIAKMA